MDIAVTQEHWPLKEPFRITGKTWSAIDTVLVAVTDGDYLGRGEGIGVHYHGETAPGMAGQVDAIVDVIRDGMTRLELIDLMPPGGARNAIDSALWDLEAKASGRSVAELAGLGEPRHLITTFTLGAASAETMAAGAVAFAQAKAIKLKLTGEPEDADRVLAVRAVRPDVWLGIDANQGLTPETLDRLMPTLMQAQVALIEQPFAPEDDEALAGWNHPIPVAADESVLDLDDVARMAGRFEVINIKLDKCGGLTRGLQMARAAKALGMGVMVGNMCGTSLSMAPAFVLGQLCDVVDLDGPLLLASDRQNPVNYVEGLISAPRALWGHRT